MTKLYKWGTNEWGPESSRKVGMIIKATWGILVEQKSFLSWPYQCHYSGCDILRCFHKGKLGQGSRNLSVLFYTTICKSTISQNKNLNANHIKKIWVTHKYRTANKLHSEARNNASKSHHRPRLVRTQLSWLLCICCSWSCPSPHWRAPDLQCSWPLPHQPWIHYFGWMSDSWSWSF